MSVHAWIGAIGGTVGIASAIVHLRDWWVNRRPRLELFAPYQGSGVDTGLNKRFVFTVIRVSNTSRATAFLYLETLSAELRYRGQWVKATMLELPTSVEHLRTDLPEPLQRHFGLDALKPLRRFASVVVAYDSPLSGLLLLDPDSDEVCQGFDAIRLVVKDCHLKAHVLKVDLDEQRWKHDPTFGGPQ